MKILEKAPAAGALLMGVLAILIRFVTSRTGSTPRKRRRISRAELYEAYERAASDPDYLADMQAVERDFECTAADGFQAVMR
jgi:hypothetical protein